MLQVVNKILNVFFNIFFPKSCYFCESKIISKNTTYQHNILCDACLNDCEKIYYSNENSQQISKENFCLRCSNIILNNNQKFCHQCLKNLPNFDSVFSVFKYQFPFKKIIHFFKYQHQFSAIPFLAEQFFYHFYNHFDFIKTNYLNNLNNLNNLNKKNLFIPMPINKQRLAERGFNQTELILKYIFKHYKKQLKTLNINISLELNLLFRKEFSKDEKVHLQAKLNAQQRKENIKDAFFIAEKFKENLQNSQIFLLDDVVTTGSTANEAAKILKANGASKVHIFSLARRL